MKYPYPLEYYEFLVAFNEQEFYTCHDLLEEIWLTDRSNLFIKGLLHLSVALYHYSYGNVKGTKAMLNSAREYLLHYEPTHWGINVERIREYIKNCQSIIPYSYTPASLKINSLPSLPSLLIEHEDVS